MCLIIRIQENATELLYLAAEKDGDKTHGWNTYRIVDSKGKEYGQIRHKYEDGFIVLSYKMLLHLKRMGVKRCGCGKMFVPYSGPVEKCAGCKGEES